MWDGECGCARDCVGGCECDGGLDLEWDCNCECECGCCCDRGCYRGAEFGVSVIVIAMELGLRLLVWL